MGFFGSLIGFDQSMGGLNAVMGSYLIEKANSSERIKIAKEVLNILTRGRPLNTDLILADISKQSRIVQTNFIALACDNLYIEPPFSGNFWTRVENPYRIGEQVSKDHIEVAIELIAKQGGGVISWPGNNDLIDFKKMYEKGTIR
jgi:hypothetical protein